MLWGNRVRSLYGDPARANAPLEIVPKANEIKAAPKIGRDGTPTLTPEQIKKEKARAVIPQKILNRVDEEEGENLSIGRSGK